MHCGQAPAREGDCNWSRRWKGVHPVRPAPRPTLRISQILWSEARPPRAWVLLHNKVAMQAIIAGIQRREAGHLFEILDGKIQLLCWRLLWWLSFKFLCQKVWWPVAGQELRDSYCLETRMLTSEQLDPGRQEKEMQQVFQIHQKGCWASLRACNCDQILSWRVLFNSQSGSLPARLKIIEWWTQLLICNFGFSTFSELSANLREKGRGQMQINKEFAIKFLLTIFQGSSKQNFPCSEWTVQWIFMAILPVQMTKAAYRFRLDTWHGWPG